MRRREFLSALSGAAASWSTAAFAQQVPLIGYLSGLGRNDRPNLADAFRRGLSAAGYVEGRNVTIEYRFAENEFGRLPELAVDLVNRNVSVIAATGGGNSILAAKAATSTIPIVFIFGGDPVRQGYVSSLNRPGANITGVSFFNTLLSAKALGLLHELLPNAKLLAFMVNPRNLESASLLRDAPEAARALGYKLLVLKASSPSDIDVAFGAMHQNQVDALFASDPFFTSRRQQIVALAARDAIPAVFTTRDFVAEGGLMSYGNDITDAYRRAALYVGRILGGEQAAELPIDQATRFEFVINLKAARALGLTVPPTLLARADEVVE
jgi:putative ABC transport system substrate-binding protein